MTSQEYSAVKSVVETVNPTRVKVAVEVPFTELEPNIKSAYSKISKQVNVPGFRKGKVPPPIIDQRFGRGVVLQEAVNDALPELYGQALEENELRPLGQPELDITQLDDGVEFKFTAEVDVRPQITVPEWEGIEVRVDDLEVTDDDVDEQLRELQARFGTLVGVDRPAAEGDYVMIDLSASKDGEPIEDAQASGVSYQIGVGEEMLDGMDATLTGMSEGESATFRTTLVGTHEGEEVDVEVTVGSVKEQQLPDLDDEFAQLASEFDTLEELRADVRERVLRSKRLRQAAEARDKALDTLLDAAGEVPVPEGIVQEQIQEHFSDGHGDDEHRAEVEADLRKNMRAQFVLDELVRSQELEVSQEELTEHLIERAAQARVDPNQLAQQYVQNNAVPALVAEVARGKALALVVEKANVVDESGRPVELNRLQDDGTLADEEGEAPSQPTVPGGFQFAELDESQSGDEMASGEAASASEAAEPEAAEPEAADGGELGAGAEEDEDDASGDTGVDKG
ncbi:MAG: trigger factor [Actinomycetota bacterium]